MRALLFSGIERGRARVIYTVDGKGPFIEHIDQAVDIDAHLAVREAEIQAEVPREESTPEEQFRTVLQETDPAVVKAAFKIDDAALAEAVKDPDLKSEKI